MVNVLLRRFRKLENPTLPLIESQVLALTKFREKLSQGIYDFEEVSCLCGASNSLLVSKVDRYALPVETHLCRNCGTMWTSPRMTEESLFGFYDKDYRSIYVGYPQAPDVFFSNQVAHGEKILKYVSDYIEPSKNIRIFDVGCGAGGVLLPFRENGFEVHGCDLGNEYLQRGRSVGLTLDQGDSTVLAKYGLSSLVILSHVVEHFPTPMKTLIQINQLLAKEGYVYIELPGIFHSYQTYGDFLLFLQNAHLYHFTLSTLTFLMNKAGFRLIKGDESIRALYKKDESVVATFPQSQFDKILGYLYTNEILHILHLPHQIPSLKAVVAKGVRTILGDNFVENLKVKLKSL